MEEIIYTSKLRKLLSIFIFFFGALGYCRGNIFKHEAVLLGYNEAPSSTAQNHGGILTVKTLTNQFEYFLVSEKLTQTPEFKIIIDKIYNISKGVTVEHGIYDHAQIIELQNYIAEITNPKVKNNLSSNLKMSLRKFNKGTESGYSDTQYILNVLRSMRMNPENSNFSSLVEIQSPYHLPINERGIYKPFGLAGNETVEEILNSVKPGKWESFKGNLKYLRGGPVKGLLVILGSATVQNLIAPADEYNTNPKKLPDSKLSWKPKNNK